MRSRRAVVLAALLGLVIIAAAGLQGPATFTGLRWRFEIPPVEIEPAPETADDASAAPEPIPTPAPSPAEGIGDLITIVLLIAGALAVILAVLIIIRRWLDRRRLGPTVGLWDVGALTAPAEPVVRPEPEPEPEAAAPAVVRGVEEALRSLDTEREPGDAVLKAWVGLERSAEQSGITRGGAETPTEFTRRILSRVSADDRAVASLLSLYLRARFGEHPVTAVDVSRARDALEALARSWDDGAARVPRAPARTGAPRSAGPTAWPTE